MIYFSQFQWQVISVISQQFNNKEMNPNIELCQERFTDLQISSKKHVYAFWRNMLKLYSQEHSQDVCKS